MKIKIAIVIACSVIIVIALLYLLFVKDNTGVQEIMSLLELPITDEQILSTISRTQSDDSITLTLVIDHEFFIEKSAPFDLAQCEGSRLYNDLTALIKENDMSIEEAIVKLYHIEYAIKTGIFSKVAIPRSIYIITGNRKNTLIFTNIPKGVRLPNTGKK